MIRSHRSFRRSALLLLAVFSFALVAPTVASAQNINPTDEEYGNGVLGIAAGGSEDDGGSATGASSTGGSTSGSTTSSGSSISSLPFTGLDVAAIAAIGLGLVGTGLLVRRAARNADTA